MTTPYDDLHSIPPVFPVPDVVLLPEIASSLSSYSLDNFEVCSECNQAFSLSLYAYCPSCDPPCDDAYF